MTVEREDPPQPVGVSWSYGTRQRAWSTCDKHNIPRPQQHDECYGESKRGDATTIASIAGCSGIHSRPSRGRAQLETSPYYALELSSAAEAKKQDSYTFVKIAAEFFKTAKCINMNTQWVLKSET